MVYTSFFGPSFRLSTRMVITLGNHMCSTDRDSAWLAKFHKQNRGANTNHPQNPPRQKPPKHRATNHPNTPWKTERCVYFSCVIIVQQRITNQAKPNRFDGFTRLKEVLRMYIIVFARKVFDKTSSFSTISSAFFCPSAWASMKLAALPPVSNRVPPTGAGCPPVNREVLHCPSSCPLHHPPIGIQLSLTNCRLKSQCRRYVNIIDLQFGISILWVCASSGNQLCSLFPTYGQ